MKKTKKIGLIIIVFILIVIGILIYFINNMENIKFKNKVNELINYIVNLDPNEYYYKDGVLYDNKNNIITTKYYINAEGSIIKDKYKNIKLKIQTEKFCAYKTSYGKLKVKTECQEIDIRGANPTVNNSKVSFILNDNVKYYMLSKEDKLNNKWIEIDNKSLILNLYEEGEYFIWFIDKEGRLTDPIKFNVKCLHSEYTPYNKDIFYCTNSILLIDNENWIVIKDENKEITLMKLDSLDVKLSHTTEEENYSWGKSNINKYLNTIYINTLSKDIKSNLKDVDICDNTSGTPGCDGDDGCGGYKKEIIDKYKWSCDSYTKSKIRLISYDEYILLYDSIKDKTIIYGHYWMINSYKENSKALAITNNGDVYLDENTTTKLEIKPVITLTR